MCTDSGRGGRVGGVCGGAQRTHPRTSAQIRGGTPTGCKGLYKAAHLLLEELGCGGGIGGGAGQPGGLVHVPRARALAAPQAPAVQVRAVQAAAARLRADRQQLRHCRRVGSLRPEACKLGFLGVCLRQPVPCQKNQSTCVQAAAARLHAGSQQFSCHRQVCNLCHRNAFEDHAPSALDCAKVSGFKCPGGCCTAAHSQEQLCHCRQACSMCCKVSEEELGCPDGGCTSAQSQPAAPPLPRGCAACALEGCRDLHIRLLPETRTAYAELHAS